MRSFVQKKELGPDKGSSALSMAAKLADAASPLLAMTGVGIPLALALHTCAMGVKMMEETNELTLKVKECKTYLLEWSKVCISNNVVYEKYNTMAVEYYKKKIESLGKDNDDDAKKKKQIYQYKLNYITALLDQMQDKNESFSDLMLSLSIYIEKCLKTNIPNLLTGGQAKIDVIQDLITKLVVQFGLFSEVTKETKDLCDYCINLTDDETRVKAGQEQEGGGSLFSIPKIPEGLRDFTQSAATKMKETTGRFSDKAAKVSRDALTELHTQGQKVVNQIKTAIGDLSDRVKKLASSESEQMLLANDISKAILDDRFNNKRVNKAMEKVDETKISKAEYDKSKEDFLNEVKDKIKLSDGDLEKLKRTDVKDLEAQEKKKTEEKESRFKRFMNLFSWRKKTNGGLSTRRKRKRRPKFHQVRSYKQRPKQHRLK